MTDLYGLKLLYRPTNGVGGHNIKKVEVNIDSNGCYNVISHKINSKGYATFFREGKVRKIHRYLYEKVNGKLNKDLCVRHLCNNRGCINPEHLMKGTNYENVQDRINFGVCPIGEINGKSKYSFKDVKNIFLAQGNAKEIGKRFNMNPKYVYKIKSGERWKRTLLEKGVISN